MGILWVIVLIVGIIFIHDIKSVLLSTLLGGVAAALYLFHMYRMLDVNLGRDEKQAVKGIFSGYILRYAVVAVVLYVAAVYKPFNIYIVFACIITVKIGALLQPFTHKLLNRFK